jgi:hypothetical protein
MMGDHEVIGAFIGLTKLVIPVAFYAMGTLVSIIQAFVFTLLSMIYVALAISHGHDEKHEHEAHHLNMHNKHIIKRWAAVARMRIEEWQA